MFLVISDEWKYVRAQSFFQKLTVLCLEIIPLKGKICINNIHLTGNLSKEVF